MCSWNSLLMMVDKINVLDLHRLMMSLNIKFVLHECVVRAQELK